MAPGPPQALTAGVLTIMVVLAAWVLLSLPLAVLVGSLFSHQERYASGAPTQSSPPRVPLQAGSAA